MVELQRLKSLSLFSGLGGMDVGLEAAGFEPIISVEMDPVAAASLKANRPNWELMDRQTVEFFAATMTPADFGLAPGELDLICGGPPCQPFSTAAQWSANGRRGMGDSRANSLSALMDTVERFQPKFVLLENVRGFVEGHRSGLKYLADRVKECNTSLRLNYRIEHRVINAAHYGVPQNRVRSIVVIHNAEQPLEWPKPDFAEHPLTAWDALHGFSNIDPAPHAIGKWAELLPSVPEGKNYQWFTEKGGGLELFGYRTRYWNFLLKLSRHLPSWTLSASPGPATGPFHWDSRPLAAVEQLALQSFPDNWQVLGNHAQQTRQIGNATPPLLAEVVGTMIYQHVRGRKDEVKYKLERQRASVPPDSPLAVSPVPRKYIILGGSKAPHPGPGRGPSSSRR